MSSPNPKPERSSSFSFGKLKGALRRPSKNSVSNGTASPERTEGRASQESNASSTTKPSTVPASPPSSPGKTPSLRRSSVDQGKPTRHGRSSSLSVVTPPPTGEKPAEFDPFSEAHDTEKGSKSRTWSVRKTVKGALKRTASRLSVSSVTSVTKPAAGTEAPESEKVADVVSDEPQAIDPTNAVTPPPTYSPRLEAAPLAVEQETLPQDPVVEPPAAPAVAEPVVVAQEVQVPAEVQKEEQEDQEAKSSASQELELVASRTSLEWEHVEAEPAPTPAVTSDTQSKEQASDDEVVHEAITVEATPEVPAIVEPETKQSDSKGLAPLNVATVSRQHLNASHLRSEITELSPILESPLTARDEKQPIPFEAPSPVAPSVPVALVAEVPPSPAPIEKVPSTPAPVVDTSNLPAPSAQNRDASTPRLNAIELGVAPKDQSKDAVVNHYDLEGPTTTHTNTDSSQADTALNSYGLIANTAWFVGACVVVGIGMIVGQVRSYRQVYRSTVMPVKRWFSFDWWKL